LWTPGNQQFRGIYINTPVDSIWVPTNDNLTRMLVLGSSIEGGGNGYPDTPFYMWSQLFAQLAGISDT
jgi:hypothetical protein